jgi:hypothetical protein
MAGRTHPEKTSHPGELPAAEPLEVEVERLPEKDSPREIDPRLAVLRALGPVAAGLCIDLVDFATFPPVLGLSFGALAGWWVGGRMALPLRLRVWLAAAAALYCALPGTNALPVGTILGALSRFRPPGRP